MRKPFILTPANIKDLLRCEGDRYYWNPRPREMFTTDGYWKRWNNRFAHAETLTAPSGDGYLAVRVFGKAYKVHRVIWAFHYGEWPSGQIDHINGDTTDNRIENLRCVDNVENGRNRKVGINNTSGMMGVCWHKRRLAWQVSVKVNGKRNYYGYFDDIDEAQRVRKDAERSLGFHANHGRMQRRSNRDGSKEQAQASASNRGCHTDR